jgi:flagellar biogenesis protein FliO
VAEHTTEGGEAVTIVGILVVIILILIVIYLIRRV